MYFVDREKIETTLLFLEKQYSLFEELKDVYTSIEKAALERVCHLIIESILDVGNAMIDGFIMRDPGSYDDIVDILDDEKVIHDELTNSCKILIQYRKMLVQNYTEVNHDEVQAEFRKHLSVMQQFPEKVRAYLQDELGPVSAFRN
ncbi:DUF86 domain-containing protein [Cytobacillus depressus]|uniref:DUF86 domain-containing protein n=1 Tax=Cytobacillus depressus TaxID=1602942 RepID=A0A6L3V9Q5_9BACI|nr:DUF86 domain-containing protein [Cytobacillus depressus]KAB2334745.1 DUF86 domain-containing protein [Cytobacillus depressus]